MINVASLARRSYVTVDALCAGCIETDSGPVATHLQELCDVRLSLYGRQLAAKTLCNTGPHSIVACYTSPRRRLSVSYRFMASAADVGGQQIVTQHTANLEVVCRTDGYFEQRRH